MKIPDVKKYQIVYLGLGFLLYLGYSRLLKSILSQTGFGESAIGLWSANCSLLLIYPLYQVFIRRRSGHGKKTAYWLILFLLPSLKIVSRTNDYGNVTFHGMPEICPLGDAVSNVLQKTAYWAMSGGPEASDIFTVIQIIMMLLAICIYTGWKKFVRL